MSSDIHKMTTNIHVAILEPIQTARAAAVIRRHASNERELAEFEQMVIPKEFRCAGCGRQFPVPSMARDHERQHEKEQENE